MNNYAVMILEDDIQTSYTLESTINQHDRFEVVAVSSTCEQALEHFERYRPTLVFIDITLPDGSGIDVIRRLRDSNAACDFIMTTAERETSVIEQAVHLGVIDYLVKPIRMSRVHHALDDFYKYKQRLTISEVVDQGAVDQILRKSPDHSTRRTPKGIDGTTLASMRQILENQDLVEFSASDIGKQMHVSRVTARRYLEFLESEGEIQLLLKYNTGGRPQRLYQRAK